MKKVIKLVIVIFIITLLFELLVFVFKTKHDYEYEVKTENSTFKVKEVFKNKKYYILITNKNYKYSFEVGNHFHKRKKIVSNIIEYKTKNTLCIYPALKKNNYSNIICSKDNKTYSYIYYAKDLKPFVKNLKKKGYKNNSWNKNSAYQTRVGTAKVYSNNINDDTYIYIYKYNGFYAISKTKNENIKLFKNDNYNNTLGSKINKYYIVPNYDQKYDYKEFYVINMKTNKVKTRTYKYSISKDSYINGIIAEEIYIFDKDELKQYKIYKNGRKISEIGNKENKILYYNLGFTRKNAYSFRDEEITFKTTKDYISKIENATDLNYIRSSNDSYYYQLSNNDVYYYNTNNKQKVLLFNKKISDFILLNDTLYFISGDTFYSYSDLSGLKKLIVYSELQFNPKNRIAIYSE